MTTRSAKETIKLAKDFAQKLKGREVIGLIGDLGSGKTTFTKGIAEGLGIKELITSPTFVILKQYDGRIENRKIEVIHIDAYRAETPDDIKSVGIEDYFGRDDVVVVVEWAEKVKEILPKSTIYIEFKYRYKDEREISI